MPYYKRIRELREDHDLTQKEVASYLNMKQPQYLRTAYYSVKYIVGSFIKYIGKFAKHHFFSLF